MPRVSAPVFNFNSAKISSPKPAKEEKDLFHKNEDYLDPDLIVNWPKEASKHLQDAYDEIDRLKIKCGEKVQEFNDHFDNESDDDYEDEENYDDDEEDYGR